MKIVYFTTGFFEYVIELANAASTFERHEVILILPDETDKSLLEIINPRVTLRLFRNIDFVSIRQNLRWLMDVRRILVEIRPDVVHVQSYGHRWFHWLYLSWPRYALYNTIHDPTPHSGDLISIKSLAIMKQCLRWLPRFTKGVFVHGQSLKEELLKNRLFTNKPVCVIPHGEFSVYRKFENNCNKLKLPDRYILFFGRIWHYKGLDIFLDAAKIVLKHDPFQNFLIAGKGEDLSVYLNQVKEFSDRFLFLNYKIPNEEVSCIFKNCFFVVLPYREATQSGVIPLSFAFRKTVVATSVGALPEVIKNYENGILVPPNDPVVLAEAILRLINSDSLRTNLEEGASYTARNEMCWKRIAKASIFFYQQNTNL